MARPRTKKEAKAPQSSLGKALDFIKPAQVDKLGEEAGKTHCRLTGGYAVAFNGVLAMGHPIDEDLSVCPHTYRLIDALKRSKQALSITQLDGDRLTIKSGGFRAVIPCLNPSAVPFAAPDVQVGVIDDTIKDGLTLLNPLVSGTGETVVEASILLRNNSMVATDRLVMVEYWHGINLPDNLAIPKETVNVICKIGLVLVGIGVSNNTVTFHYDGGAWVRTQLYSDPWPASSIDRVFAQADPNKAVAVPPALFDAVDAVAAFGHDLLSNGGVYTLDGMLGSHRDPNIGATYEIEGITPGLVFGAKHLKAIKGLATTIDLVGANGITYFYGERVRGAVTQRSPGA